MSRDMEGELCVHAQCGASTSFRSPDPRCSGGVMQGTWARCVKVVGGWAGARLSCRRVQACRWVEAGVRAAATAAARAGRHPPRGRRA